MFLHANTIKKYQTMTYMPNIIFSCQTTFKKAKIWDLALKMPTWQLWYNGRRCGQRSTTTGDYYITHSMQYVRSRWCTAYCTPLQQLRFWIHL